jgi:hypothetical protein
MPIKFRRGSRRGSIVAAVVGGLEPRPPHRWIVTLMFVSVES